VNIILWDIDGTLISKNKKFTRSVHMDSLERYFKRDLIPVSETEGMTDLEVILKILKKNNICLGLRETQQVLNMIDHLTYYDIKKGIYNPYHLNPNIIDILKLGNIHNWHNGVATGNTKIRGMLKLGSCDLVEYFSRHYLFFGGHVASRKIFMQNLKNVLQIENIIIVGDTPYDVKVAAELGYDTVAVATGRYSMHELSSPAPTLLIENLDNGKNDFVEFIISRI